MEGVPARSLCRSHLRGHHAGQPVALVVCLNGLCVAVRSASNRFRSNAPPTPPVVPSVSSCSRLALWCSSASAGSKSGWRQPVQQRMSGDRPPVASPPPQAPAARPPDTRRRIASFARHHPKAHRDRFFAAPAAQNDSSTPRADRRHPQACSQHLKHGTRNVRPIARWYGEIYGLDSFGQMILSGEVREAGNVGLKLQLDRTGWTMALLADNDLGLAVNGIHLGLPFEVLLGAGSRLFVLEVILFTEDKHHHIGVLLNRPRLAQVGELRTFIIAVLNLTRELG